MNILITGATGFLGQNLCSAALDRKYSIRATTRSASKPPQLAPEIESIPIASISEPLPEAALVGIDAIVHLAARVHVMNDTTSDPLAAHRQVNTAATLSLARQAAQYGVKRFIYISSIKVNGEGGIDVNRPYTEQDLPQPVDPYGQSKWEAEQGLNQIAAETGLEIVIIRPPLVYGAKVKGNFQQLLRTIQLGIPLPFGRIDNHRSLVYVGNLVDAILTCITHPAAKNQTFLVSDGKDLSTPALILSLAQYVVKPDWMKAIGLPSLVSISPQLLVWFGKLVGQTASVERLLGSLTVDITHIQATLDWKPPFSVNEGLRATVKDLSNPVKISNHTTEPIYIP
jgi:nucleoside-diphosphate-sugar epimerase